jgi:hypothetical protein
MTATVLERIFKQQWQDVLSKSFVLSSTGRYGCMCAQATSYCLSWSSNLYILAQVQPMQADCYKNHHRVVLLSAPLSRHIVLLSMQELHVQAEVAPGCWLPIIISKPFVLPTSDYETLLQSHTEGLYVVGSSPDEQEQEEDAEEQQEGAAGGVMFAEPGDWVPPASVPGSGREDREGGAGPGVKTDAAVAVAAAARGPLDAHWHQQQQQPQEQPQLPQLPQQQQQQQQGQLPQGQQQQARALPFGLVAYVHYQQLLGVAGGVVPVPQSIPLAAAPRLREWEELPGAICGGSDPSTFTALRLHLDFHKLKTR